LQTPTTTSVVFIDRMQCDALVCSERSCPGSATASHSTRAVDRTPNLSGGRRTLWVYQSLYICFYEEYF